jgi:hypothetical protein
MSKHITQPPQIGYNEKQILNICFDLRSWRELKENQDKIANYHGGNRFRYGDRLHRVISIGRNRERYWNVPDYIIDTREAWAAWRSSDHFADRKAFNRAIHSLVRKKLLTPVFRQNIESEQYEIDHDRYYDYWMNHAQERLRFVVMRKMATKSPIKGSTWIMAIEDYDKAVRLNSRRRKVRVDNALSTPTRGEGEIGTEEE